MDLTLCVRPGDDGIIVTVSGEVDVGTEGLLRQALLRIMRERGARLLLDVSGVSFMDCAGLRMLLTTRRNAELRGGFMQLIAVSRAVRRIMELTGAHEALAAEREPRTVRVQSFFYRTDRMRRTDRTVWTDRWEAAMMHVRISLITAAPSVLAGCLAYLEGKVRPVVESELRQPGAVAAGGRGSRRRDRRIVLGHARALWLSEGTEALVRGELARRVKRPVTAEDYQVAVFEREAPLRSGEAVRLTRVQVKPPGVADVVDVYGDTAVPRLADTPGSRRAAVRAPASGQLISQTVWRDPPARAASPGVAEMIRAEVLDEDGCEIRAVEDYRLVFNSARKPGRAWW